MREIFFYVFGGCLAAAVIGWSLYMVARAVAQVFSDLKLGRELDQIEAESVARRQQRKQTQEERLNNGCEHDFSAGAIGLPPNVCKKCGLEKERTSSLCDHIWKVKPGPTPFSECERCGKVYRSVPHASDTARP